MFRILFSSLFKGRPLHVRGKSSQRGVNGDNDPLHASAGSAKGLKPIMKAAVTSGSLSLAGDLVAQAATQQLSQGKVELSGIDAERMGRMFGFGFFFYGPYQHYWYSLLDWRFPQRIPQHFITKVFLNQTVLAPIVLTAVFSWNLMLQQRPKEIPKKLQKDLLPTMMNGWKFWIPASSINFYLVPLQHQVLYMSCCGLLWTAYLSYSSYKT